MPAVGATWSFLVYAAIVVGLTATMIGLPMVLGQRHRDLGTSDHYESGIDPAGGMPRRFSIEFYQVAIFFVVFDLEAAFIFGWAVAARGLGWTGYVELAVFVTLLAAALAYLWRLRALDWGTSGRSRRGRG
jgi:NADH-quinone oxidoreductase subunit A